MRIGILPVYNEASGLPRVLPELAPYFQLLIVIDDGSTDASSQWLKDWAKGRENTFLISLPKNSGKARALLAGFNQVLELKNNGQIPPDALVFTTDADGQIPAKIIPIAELKIKQKKFDLLIGRRDFSLYPLYKILGNRLLTLNASRISGFPYQDSECGFRVFTLPAIEKLLPCLKGERYGLEQEIAALAPRMGLKVSNDLPVKPVFYRSNTKIKDFIANLVTGWRASTRNPKLKEGKPQ